MSKPLISIIVAMDKNNLIGKMKKIPWFIPGELKRFRNITMNKPIVMGRKTHESIGKILDGRENIVLSQNKSYTKTGIKVFHNFDEIITNYKNCKEIMVIGGSEVYKIALPFTNKLYITHINEVFEGDTWFPKLNFDDWNIIKSEDVFNNETQIQYSAKIYSRSNE